MRHSAHHGRHRVHILHLRPLAVDHRDVQFLRRVVAHHTSVGLSVRLVLQSEIVQNIKDIIAVTIMKAVVDAKRDLFPVLQLHGSIINRIGQEQ